MPIDGSGEQILRWSIDTAYNYRACSLKHQATVDFYNEMRELINGRN